MSEGKRGKSLAASAGGGPDVITIPSITKPSNKQGLRFSLRRMLYNSPLVNQRRSRSSSSSGGTNTATAGTSSGLSHSSGKKKKSTTTVKYESEVSSEVSGSSHSDTVSSSRTSKCCAEGDNIECPLCLAEYPKTFFPDLLCCSHQACLECLQQYLRIEISESRINISCPECSELMHPNDIRTILNDETLLEKYEDFMLRRVLAADPDSRWCPAPDCSYAVIASGCASCPRLQCQRSGCRALFCYHCKALWHPNQTCDAARAQRTPLYGSSSVSFSSKHTQREDIKPCPRCQVLITKMDDGSCNHMTCTLCGAEFCWLCMKEISDLHYLSPSGCTFWGKKPWSRKKKILWQLGTLAGAPVGIALLAGIAVPAMIIGIPIWVGRKLYARYKSSSRHQRNIIITSGVAASILVAPAVAGVAVGVGVPVLLAYVYGVVPVSLCRSGVCGVTASPRGVRIDFDDEENANGPEVEGEAAFYVPGTKNNAGDAISVDTANHGVGNPSIGEASVALSASGSASLGSTNHIFRPESDREDCESASQIGLAGSIASRRLEVQAEVSAKRLSFASETASATISLSERSATLSMADDGAASTRALAGSLLSYKMDSGSVHSYRLHGSSHPHSACGSVKSGYAPVEVHVDAASQRSEPEDEPAQLRSSSPVSNFSASGDEVHPIVRRSARKTRCLVDRQVSDNASLQSIDDQPVTSSSDHVRFDDNVSYIDRTIDSSPAGSTHEDSMAPIQLP